ncbi:TDP-N-acetylfucosamine:lipid II N-acetylfucosaminyltransferase [Nautilia sp. PV-1]|uniref:TDP-N-acetylfucosamine:lipid II N-acetylfucosaminyltransferase n=1 Tax=Nautilia sp. PV-1 TaxID=2579250 RepID=UPI00143B94F8|nr:TDP-N-acetylfucosamine:lipid II N-acetylfucosaminyltransferase [Nautilia sp. PV-1]
MVLDKFIPPFIEFVNKHFDSKEHLFIFIGRKNTQYEIQEYQNIIWIDKKTKVFSLLRYLYKADKIIIHGLWNRHFLKILYLNPWLLKKSYWIMWGGDFYFPEKQSWVKKQVIKKMGNFITYIEGDYELVKKWYKAEGNYYKCFMYPSNLYKDVSFDVEKKLNRNIIIQIGNSADPTNNHFEILEKLSKYRDENIKIYAPLSYGDIVYAEKVIKEGKKIFKDKFIPLTDFMQFDKYLEFLNNIDIAIFAHNRQQAMGNIITLLGLGKKVYMKSDITPWQMFNELGIKVFDVENIKLSLLDEKTKKENIEKIKIHFSEENLKKQLEEIFRS